MNKGIRQIECLLSAIVLTKGLSVFYIRGWYYSARCLERFDRNQSKGRIAMGIYVNYLSEIPREYTLYGVFIADGYGTVAERTVCENFEKLANDIGSKNIVASILKWEGAAQATETFKIKDNDLRPILIITDVHPAEWTPQDTMLKIQLGRIESADRIRHFLSQLARWLADEDLGKVRWELRLKRLKELVKKIPAIIDLLKP